MNMRFIASTSLWVLASTGIFGQSTDGQAVFEVASIKPSALPTGGRIFLGTRGGPGTDDPGRFTCTNCTLLMLITTAYSVQPFQVSGPPALSTERFEIVAKVPEGATKEQFRQMLQNLLAEQFKLTLHHDSKEMPLYQLVVARGGPKMKESAETTKTENTAAPAAPGPMKRDAEGYPVLTPGQSVMAMTPGHARMQGAQQTMPEFATRLSAFLGRPVTDATSLNGKYDFVLSWAPEPNRGLIPGLPPPPPGADTIAPAAADPQDSGPTIFTALQEQLGLKLEQKKGPVDMLVIDHVEKVPTEN